MKYKRITAVIIILCMTFSLCSCSASSRLVGNWICDEATNGYPDQITFRKDGTGIGDGLPFNWTIENGYITFDIETIIGGYTQEYDYEFIGSKLFMDGHGYKKN